jgi:hypothetical protein
VAVALSVFCGIVVCRVGWVGMFIDNIGLETRALSVCFDIWSLFVYIYNWEE